MVETCKRMKSVEQSIATRCFPMADVRRHSQWCGQCVINRCADVGQLLLLPLISVFSAPKSILSGTVLSVSSHTHNIIN